MKNKRDEKEFEESRKEIEELKEQQRSGKIDLVYYDESGFSLGSRVPYAYQPVGETIGIEASGRKRLNVIGFMSPDNRMESFCFEGTVHTGVVIGCFDLFSEIIDKKTVVIPDNSSIHRSKEFEEKIPEWEGKGLFVKYLPTYSPEPDLIEIGWRFMKYVVTVECVFVIRQFGEFGGTYPEKFRNGISD